MNELITHLQEIRPDIDFATTTSLMSAGVLDSFDVVAIIGELASSYDITIPVEEIEPENFDSAQAIWDMVQRIQLEGA